MIYHENCVYVCNRRYILEREGEQKSICVYVGVCVCLVWMPINKIIFFAAVN